MKRLFYIAAATIVMAVTSCGQHVDPESLPKAIVVSATIDGKAVLESGTVNGVSLQPQILLSFSEERR